MITTDLAAEFCRRVDWELPALAPFRSLHEAGDHARAALGVIRCLRERETPRLGYAREYIAALRTQAPAEERLAAVSRWEAAQVRDLLMPYHGNAFGALGAETTFLAATPERCRRLAARVIENQARWTEGYWGVAHSICEVLRWLIPLDECADEDLLPIFCWLFAKSDGEWEWARDWDESNLGSSGHNWWAHTFLGFFMMGLFFPEFAGWGRFRALAADYLECELAILFEADGWSKEGSPGYHGFAMRSLLEFAHLAELNGIVLSETARRKLRTIANAGWQLMAPDGDYPVFADHVRETRYQGFHGQDRPEFQPCMELRRLAARFTLPEAKYVAEALDPEWQLPYGCLLPDHGDDLQHVYRRVPAVAPPLDTVLPDSGLYAIRSNWTSRADYAALIAGTLGPRVSSHKHADIFSFELYSRGRRILVDNWYGPVSEMRENDNVRMWRVGSAAHNTVTVDGADCVPVVQEFLLGATIHPLVDDWRSTADYAYFSGVHEGYLNLPAHKISAVRRKLFYLRDGYWILLDRFTADDDAEHRYELHFHLNVPSTLGQQGRVTTHGDGGNLLIVPVPDAAGVATLGPNPWPVEGYENPDHLVYTRKTAGRDLFATLLIPFDGVAPAVETRLLDVAADGRTLSPWEATGLEIVIDGQRDVYVDYHMHWNLPWNCGGCTGDGRLFHSRCR